MSTRRRWIVELVDRVVVDQVRTGRLRVADWTPAMVAQGLVPAATAIAALVTILAAGWLRQEFGLFAWSGISLPLVVFGPVMVIAAITLAFVLSGLLQAGWGWRLIALVAATASLASVGYTVVDWRRQPASVAILGAMAGFLLLVILGRWTRRWWLASVVLALVGVGIFIPVVAFRDPETDVTALALLISVLGSLAAAPTIVLAVAASEVALSTSVWAAETGTARLTARQTVWLAISGTVCVLAGLVVVLLKDPVPADRALASLALAAIAVGVALVVQLSSGAMSSTSGGQAERLTGMVDQMRPLLWAVAAIMGGIFFLTMSGNVVTGWSRSWFSTPAVNWSAGILANTAAFARLSGAVVCLVFALRFWRRRQPLVAVSAIVLAVVLASSGGAGMGWWSRLWNQTSLATMMALLTFVALGWLAARRQLDQARATRILAMAALSVAVVLPDLVSDPVGVLLGLTGAGAVFFGVVWNLLTNAELANADSARFPRQGRVLLLLGLVLVTLLHFMLASVVTSGTLAALIDISTTIGTTEIGTAVLLGGWALLLAGTLAPQRPTPPMDPTWPAPVGAPIRPPDWQPVR